VSISPTPETSPINPAEKKAELRSRTVDTRTLPAYITGRPADYFCETNPIFPNLQSLTARGDIPDTMVYSPIRAGIRVSCADKSLSTTLGAFVAHPDGRRRFMVASHGFPQGGAVMHQYDERRVGNLKEVFPGSDISLAEVQEGVSSDTSDYFEVAPPRRMAPLQDPNSVTTLSRTACRQTRPT
jgi:hypothetical protein